MPPKKLPIYKRPLTDTQIRSWENTLFLYEYPLLRLCEEPLSGDAAIHSLLRHCKEPLSGDAAIHSLMI